MIINYKIDNFTSTQKNINNDISFILLDNQGGYFWDKQKSESRYQGWFVHLNGQVFKIFDSLKVNHQNQALQSIHLSENKQQAVITRYNVGEERYLNTGNCFQYNPSRISDISIFLDIRPLHCFPTWDRVYNIYSNKAYLIIKYSHPTHEDIFIAISKKNILHWDKIENWVKKEYLYDKKRHSFPSQLYIFKALKIKTQSLILEVGLSENEAIQRIESIKNTVTSHRKKLSPKLKTETFAHNLSQVALKSFLIDIDDDFFGLYAGIPWFMEFWLRDEAISLKALYEIMPDKTIKLSQIRFKQIINDNFPSRVIKSNDGILWYIYRFFAMNLLEFNKQDIKKLVTISEKAYLTSDSWMDTLKRQNALENYCLQLTIYHYAYKITQKVLFLNKEKELKKLTKSIFWNGSFLADTKDDRIIRPNIFLAYYLYPALLEKQEWEICFDTALKNLWCQWGGLSTIAQHNFQYHKKHTGEDPASYHQGDSWFWLNNLAALCMLKLNQQKYQIYISKIKQASLEDLFSYQVLGFSSELSSADSLNPAGSPAQAWSSATLIEILSSS